MSSSLMFVHNILWRWYLVGDTINKHHCEAAKAFFCHWRTYSTLEWTLQIVHIHSNFNRGVCILLLTICTHRGQPISRPWKWQTIASHYNQKSGGRGGLCLPSASYGSDVMWMNNKSQNWGAAESIERQIHELIIIPVFQLTCNCSNWFPQTD